AGKEIRLVIDLEELGMTGADLVVLAGDYAGNERAILLSHGDKLKVRTYAYVLTDTIEDGGEYIIANSITPGRAAALASQGTDAFTASRNVTVKFDETYGIHIPVESADDSFVWGAIATPYGAALYNLDDYGFLGYVQLEYPYVDWSDPGYADFFGYDAENHALINTAVSSEDAKYYVAYSQGYYLYTMTPGLVGLYEKKAFEQEMTLEELMSVSVTPEEGLLPVGEELQLTAEVTPAYLDDLTVSWSSSDPDVATVSADGVVKALSPGTVTITAASHENPSVKGEAVIRVEASKSLDVILYGNIETAEGPQFAAIDFGVRLTGKVGDAAKTLLGGGRAGNYLYGVTVDESYERYDLTDEFKATAIVESLNMAYAVADAAAFPAMVLQEEVENDDSDAPIFPLEFDSVSVLPNKEWFALWQGDDLWYFPTQELYGFNLVALAYAGNLDNNLFYYGLGDDEHLYLLIMLPGIYEDEDTGEKYADVDLMPIDLGVVPGLSIDEASFAYSLSYIYEQTGEEDLILADNTNQTFWKINVGENEEEETVLTLEFLWKAEELLSVSALFNNYWDAETSLKAAPSPMIKALSAKPAAGTVRAQKAQLPAYPQSALTAGRPINPHADEIRRAQVLVEAPAAGAARVIAPEEAGTLSIVPDVQELVGFVTVSLTETEKTANGFIEIEYDPNEIDFLGIFTGEDAPYYSVNLIEGENGNVVRFAFASLTALEEETAVAMAVFQPHCEDAELTFRVLERGADTAVEETETAQTPGTGHDWEEPSYEWNEDHTEMTATRICRNDPEHKETEVVKSTAEVTVDPTCEGTGVRVYTALFENEAFETQTFEEEIEALGHDWDEPDYEWNEDHTEMTATRICKNDPEHRETEKVQAEKTTVDPTCTEDGKNTYTAVFENEGFETQVYEEVIAAIGHDWDEGTVTKEPGPAENGILHHVCRNDASHTFDEEIPATGVVDPPETGEDDSLSLWALVLAAALTALGLQTYVVRKFELGENDR
ncbi:MAG: Ig-like domain-containing protein, partial [Lachnospiraceae bacterium]|nr:Ig-like domain-containing protein [Lachnospiraceae bacterium]